MTKRWRFILMLCSSVSFVRQICVLKLTSNFWFHIFKFHKLKPCRLSCFFFCPHTLHVKVIHWLPSSSISNANNMLTFSRVLISMIFHEKNVTQILFITNTLTFSCLGRSFCDKLACRSSHKVTSSAKIEWLTKR